MAGESQQDQSYAAKVGSGKTNAINKSQQMLATDNEDVLYIAKTIYGEARGQNRESKTAVGWVIRNRLKDGRWGSSYRQVVTARLQFTCWSKTTDPNNYRAIQNPSGAAWDESLSVAREIYIASEIANTVPQATHYFSPRSQEALHRVRPRLYPAQPSFMNPPSQPVEVPAPTGVSPRDFLFYRGIR